MSAELFQILLLLGYVVLCVGFAVVMLFYIRHRRKTRWPFKASDRLLRGPGESLRKQVITLDERVVVEICAVIFSGCGAFIIGIYGNRSFHVTGLPAVLVVITCLLVAAVWHGRRLTRYVVKRTDLVLGWFGERLAAEKLRPLLGFGYYVFHDVPAEPAPNAFNIDHVVVGPTGVTVVEVKTRRKGNARPGWQEHEVTFDGSKLVWPWGEDRHGIDQAIGEADWLRKWLFERTGLRVVVNPVLTIPGWWVHESPSRLLRVVNPSFLPSVVRGRDEVVLLPKEIDLICRQLDERCRDVEE